MRRVSLSLAFLLLCLSMVAIACGPSLDDDDTAGDDDDSVIGDDDDSVITLNVDLYGTGQIAAHVLIQRCPIIFWIICGQSELGLMVTNRVSVDCEPR